MQENTKKPQFIEKIKVLAIDADDTLWDCQGHFDRVMQRLYDELLPWTGSREEAAKALIATERKNMALLGYGTKAFTLSMLETAMRVSNNEMPAAKLNEILQKCYELNTFPCDPLPGVRQTLGELRQAFASETSNCHSSEGQQRPQVKIICFTKGELLDQQNKLHRSGLAPLFDDVIITSDKTEHEFRQLCQRYAIAPDELLMVGNSLKSDIAPALSIGAWAVYIPFHVTWELEHAEHFEHPRMQQITTFDELLPLLRS